MTIRTTFINRDEPLEIEYTNPVECVVCSKEWDGDDHVGEEFRHHEDTYQVVCIGRCYDDLTERLGGEYENEIWEDAA
jgi:hypothetical protein